MTFQILSLSGGGYLGLYTVSVLAQWEKDLGRPIAKCFDLLAGTSIGGIIALALAAEVPAADLQRLFEIEGTRIFSDRPVPTNKLGKLRDFGRILGSSKYDGKALRQTITRALGEHTKMGDLKHPVVIPAVNLTKGQPQIFKTAHHTDFKRDHHLSVVDVAMATSAAPTYFPIATIGDELFVDGGLYANSPDLIALHEAEHFFQIPTDAIRILSLGTTTTQFSISHPERLDLGAADWAPRLPQVMIASQQRHVEYMLQHRLGDRYLRIDSAQSADQQRNLALDVATSQAQKTIRALSAATYQQYMNSPRLMQMANHCSPETIFFHKTPSPSEQVG